MDTNNKVEEKPEVQKQIVKHYAGSISYGTNTATSDTDYRGIFLAPQKYIMTPWWNVREVSDETEEDTKLFELNNYLDLYLDANPNVIETLWVRDQDIVQRTEEYDVLRKYAQQLLSTKIAFTYTGYAHNQATRMKNHHGWMDKERTGIRNLQHYIDSTPCVQMQEWVKDTFPEYVYNLLDFSKCKNYLKTSLKTEVFMRNSTLQMLSTQPLGQYHFIKLVHNYLPEKVLDRDFSIMDYNDGYELLPYGENIYAVVKKEGSWCINKDGSIHKVDTSNRPVEELKQLPCLIVKFNKDEYLKNADNRKNYHSWKTNRNEARSELEQKNGYDTKHAMHVVRLLRTAQEALETGVINVYRPDAEELLAIRNGAWTYDEMMQYWKETDDKIRHLYYPKSELPKKPDIKLATKVLMDIREIQFYGTKDVVASPEVKIRTPASTIMQKFNSFFGK